MMTKVIVFSYCVGVRSSRKLAQAVVDQWREARRGRHRRDQDSRATRVASRQATKTHRDLVKEDRALREVTRRIFEEAERATAGLPKDLVDAKTRRVKIRKALDEFEEGNRGG